MGLAEYIKAGASLKRETLTLTTSPSGSGSVSLGSTYVLLSLTTTQPCRLRLYDNNTSLESSTEISRPFGITNISASTALIGDFSMSVAGTYTIDPALYGVIDNASSKLTHYRVNNTASGQYPNITFNTYLLEDSSITTSGRRTLPMITASLSGSQIITGTIYSAVIPQTYLLVSASVSGSNTRTRLRLYTTSASLSNTTEINRPFVSESAESSYLIVDAILSGSETTFFVPKIIGANLRNIKTNLNLIKNSRATIMGENELYYIMENASSSAVVVPISTSLHVFSLED